jgi:hypothetical protein
MMIVVGVGQKDRFHRDSERFRLFDEGNAVGRGVKEGGRVRRRIVDEVGVHPHVAVGEVEHLKPVDGDRPRRPDPRGGHGEGSGLQRQDPGYFHQRRFVAELPPAKAREDISRHARLLDQLRFREMPAPHRFGDEVFKEVFQRDVGNHGRGSRWNLQNVVEGGDFSCLISSKMPFSGRR